MKNLRPFILLLVLIIAGNEFQVRASSQSQDSVAFLDVFSEEKPLCIDLYADYVSLMDDVSANRVYHDAKFTVKNNSSAFKNMAYVNRRVISHP